MQRLCSVVTFLKKQLLWNNFSCQHLNGLGRSFATNNHLVASSHCCGNNIHVGIKKLDNKQHPAHGFLFSFFLFFFFRFCSRV